MAELTLYGSGPRTRQDWSGLVASVPNATAVWADLDGMHRGPLPDPMPVGTTHLWFWDTGRYGRIRIDGDTWIAGVLAETEKPAPAHCDTLCEHNVVIDRATITPWAAAEGRIKQFRGDRAVLTKFIQLVPRRATTGVFLTAASS